MVIFDKLVISEDGKELQVKAHVDSNAYFKDEYIQKLCIDTDKTFVSCGISSMPIYSKEYNDEVVEEEDNNTNTLENTSTPDNPSFNNGVVNLNNHVSYNAQSGIATTKKVAVFDSSNGTLSFTMNEPEEPEDPDTPTGLTGVKEINESIRIEDPAFFTFDGKNFNENLFFVYIKTNGRVGNAPCGMSSSLNMAVVYKSDRFFNTILNTAKEATDCEVPRSFLNFAILYDLFKSCLDFGYINKAIELFGKLTKNKASKRKGGCDCGRART